MPGQTILCVAKVLNDDETENSMIFETSDAEYAYWKARHWVASELGQRSGSAHIQAWRDGERLIDESFQMSSTAVTPASGRSAPPLLI
jgi:hypothetical protein